MSINESIFRDLIISEPLTGVKITLQPKDYNWPECIPTAYRPKKKTKVIIEVDHIRAAAKNGATWDQLENYYMVDVDTLKKHFFIDYMRSRAQLEINVIDSMVTSAQAGEVTIQKFLATNWLDFANKIEALPVINQTPDEETINLRLKILLDKMNPTVTK